jgi:hypothetical protein
VGQVKSKIDARFMMDDGRIFIANLSKGKLGSDKANLLGALLVTQFELAAMARADIREDERRDFFLYVDEFQSFTSDSFISVLSEARKYRLCLTLAHQYGSQLRPEIRDAVLCNVGSIIAFRVGHKDATTLQDTFCNGLTTEHFTALNNYELYAKLLNDGKDRTPVLGKSLPPTGTRHFRGETIIRRSREKYGTRRQVVEERIKRWLRSPQR